MVLAAPLLVLGRPVSPMLWALPMRWRRRVGGWAKAAPVRDGWRVLKGPFAAWMLHALALWLWHLPGPYQATLRSEAVHTLQHASFLGTGLLFWWTVVHGREGRMGYGASVFYLFATMMHSGGLGALLTFSPSPVRGVRRRHGGVGTDDAGRPAAGGAHHVGPRGARLPGGGIDPGGRVDARGGAARHALAGPRPARLDVKGRMVMRIRTTRGVMAALLALAACDGGGDAGVRARRVPHGRGPDRRT